METPERPVKGHKTDRRNGGPQRLTAWNTGARSGDSASVRGLEQIEAESQRRPSPKALRFGRSAALIHPEELSNCK